MSIKNKLNRLKPHLSINNENVDKEKVLSGEHDRKGSSIPYLLEWKLENVSPFYFDGGYCLVREKRYSLTDRHGKYHFSDFIKAVNAWNQSDLKHPLSAKGYQPSDLFFFDTETTGLGGGVGNSIFLLGQASIQSDHILLKQHILPSPGNEISFYQSFLENINYRTLVTYNGKAFDWPQVKTRHTLIREHVPKLPSFGHFDLYHAARRIWKHRLERLKLSIVEKEVLDIERVDDIPGFLAPMIYFDFVENQKPDGMLGILKHNEIDILSLVTLYTHLSFQLLRLDEKQTSSEVYEVGRWYAALGETSAAKEAFTQICGRNENVSKEAKHALAFQYKKQKEWVKAKNIWEQMVHTGESILHLEAAIELAKIYEHRYKDFTKAHDFTMKANSILSVLSQSDKLLKIGTEIDKRLMRLTKKLEN